MFAEATDLSVAPASTPLVPCWSLLCCVVPCGVATLLASSAKIEQAENNNKNKIF